MYHKTQNVNRPTKEERSNGPRQKKLKVVDCAKHAYLEIPRSADDEESNKRNLSKLREESVKAKPSTEIVKMLMIRTYPVRRASIMDSSSMVSSILTEMPMLKKCQYVSFNYIHYLTQLCCYTCINIFKMGA